MKKIVLILCLLLTTELFALETQTMPDSNENTESSSNIINNINFPPSLDNLNIGLNVGGNMNSKSGWALNAGISGDYELWHNIKLGVMFNVSYDFGSMLVMEPSLYGKWLMPFSFLIFQPFVQLNLGASVILTGQSYGKFLAGIAAGTRTYFGNFYIEPSASFGYPYMTAINVAAGWDF